MGIKKTKSANLPSDLWDKMQEVANHTSNGNLSALLEQVFNEYLAGSSKLKTAEAMEKAFRDEIQTLQKDIETLKSSSGSSGNGDGKGGKLTGKGDEPPGSDPVTFRGFRQDFVPYGTVVDHFISLDKKINDERRNNYKYMPLEYLTEHATKYRDEIKKNKETIERFTGKWEKKDIEQYEIKTKKAQVELDELDRCIALLEGKATTVTHQ